MSDSRTQPDVPPKATLPEDEQLLLDTALQESDQLLARSLQGDQRRRMRRWLLGIVIGGVVMFTLVLAILFGGLALSLPDAAEAKDKQPTREKIERAEALTSEGWQLWQRREMLAAARKFEEAVELNPKEANAWNGFGWALFNGGQPMRAERAFEQCVKLEPSHAAALNGLGQLYLSRGEYNEAEKYLTKSAENPHASAAWWGLAKVYLIKGEFKKAKSWAEKIVAVSPDDQFAQQMLAAAKEGKISDELRKLIEPAAQQRETDSTDKSTASTEDVSQCLEDLRHTAICYNLSFDQVLDERLSPYSERRLELFPGKGMWPDVLGFVAKDPEDYQGVNGDADDFSPTANGGAVFAQPLSKPIVVRDTYQTLVFLEGIAKGGAVLIDSYVTLYCRGDMAGVVNSQSYSTTIIRGNASGRMRNASYGHWVVFGDLSGTFEFESGGTLRVSGDFTGRIQLGSGKHKQLGKVFLAGHTSMDDLDRIEGTGTIYLEKSDLDVGRHSLGQLTVIVGDVP